MSTDELDLTSPTEAIEIALHEVSAQSPPKPRQCTSTENVYNVNLETVSTEKEPDEANASPVIKKVADVDATGTAGDHATMPIFLTKVGFHNNGISWEGLEDEPEAKVSKGSQGSVVKKIDKRTKKAYALKTYQQNARDEPHRSIQCRAMQRELALLLAKSSPRRYLVDVIASHYDVPSRTLSVLMEWADYTLNDVRNKVAKQKPTPKDVEEMMGVPLMRALKPLKLHRRRLPVCMPKDPEVNVRLDVVPIPDEVLACIALQLVRGLLEAEELIPRAESLCDRKGLLHEDIKPDNVLVFEQSGRLKYADFGCSTWLQSDGQYPRTPDGISCETYQSPERLNLNSMFEKRQHQE